MRVTIIRDDGVVGIDGVFRKVDLSDLPEGIRAVQWDGGAGQTEDENGINFPIDSIDVFQAFISRWGDAIPLPAPLTSAEMIDVAHTRINRAYDATIGAISGSYPQEEQKSWPKQENEARAWLVDNNANTPWLDAAAQARGISKADLVSKITGNADLFVCASGTLTGKRQNLRDQIIALGDSPTKEQLDAIQW